MNRWRPVAERTHYEVLRVPKNATQDELDAQYHQLLYQVHPDHNPGDEDKSVEKTIALVNAYRALSDPEERKKYDFKMGNPMIEEGATKGIKLLKSKEKKEAEARFAEGAGLLKAGDYPKAVEAFKAALKLEPDFPGAAYNLALIGALLNNTNFSFDVLSRALKLSPEDADLLRLRKNIHQYTQA